MRIVGYHISSTGIIANSDGEYTDKSPYLEFLLQPKPDSIRVFYYLTQNITSLAKIIKMSPDETRKLHSGTHGKAYFPPYKMQYIPNRFLQLQKGFYRNNPFAYFYDAHQYQDTRANSGETVDECLRKATQAKEIGEQVRNAMNEIGLHPKSITSPISLFDKEVISKIDLPVDSDIPEGAGRYAYECCKGNWLEAFQVGHWEIIWNYDLSSAYPAQISKLLDIRQGKWIESKEFTEEATYGYCKGRVTTQVEFSPILHKNITRNNSLLEPLMPVTHTPIGTWETYLTKQEIEFIARRKLGKFEIESGWWWIADKEVKQSLSSTINWLYQEKEKAEGIKKEIIKRVMAGIYGKMLEVRDGELGQRFNPVWAAEVETNTRLEVADFVLRNRVLDSLVHIAVDGVVLSKPVILPENGMGNWKLNNISPCICVGTGQIALRDNGKGDFHLQYDWLKEAIEKEPEKSEYVMNSVRPVTLAEALNGRFEELGELQETKKYISIGSTDKRCYKEKPKNGGELLSKTYESLPWDISMIRKGE